MGPNILRCAYIYICLYISISISRLYLSKQIDRYIYYMVYVFAAHAVLNLSWALIFFGALFFSLSLFICMYLCTFYLSIYPSGYIPGYIYRWYLSIYLDTCFTFFRRTRSWTCPGLPSSSVLLHSISIYIHIYLSIAISMSIPIFYLSIYLDTYIHTYNNVFAAHAVLNLSWAPIFFGALIYISVCIYPYLYLYSIYLSRCIDTYIHIITSSRPTPSSTYHGPQYSSVRLNIYLSLYIHIFI